MATTDDAIIKLRLDTSAAEADLRRFEQSASGVTIKARTMAQQQTTGIVDAIKGIGLGGGFAGALGAALLGPTATNLSGGAWNYARGFGTDLSAMSGATRFKAMSEVHGAARELTLSQIGGAPATREQTVALNAINEQILRMKAENTSQQGKWLGESDGIAVAERTATAAEAILDWLQKHVGIGGDIGTAIGNVGVWLKAANGGR